MAKFSASEYKKFLQKEAEKAARSKETTVPIAEKAKSVMNGVIKEKVYDSYSPHVYERRGENDGLLDTNNIAITIKDNHITVENIAKPNESIFGTPLRESPEGLLYKWIDEGRIGMPQGFEYSKHSSPWQGRRVGLTKNMANDQELKNFIGKTIVKNMK